MTNRREFLQTSVSVSALPLAINGMLAPNAARAASGDDVSASAHDNARLRKVVFDDRYAEGWAFAETLGKLSVPSHALNNGDITDFWYDELDLLWRREPAAIAGFTQFGPMFALERFGNERGLRIALRVEHQARTDGSLAHVMTGAPETLAIAEAWGRQGVYWPGVMAVALAHCRAAHTAPVTRTMVLPGATPTLARGSESYAPNLNASAPWQANQLLQPAPPRSSDTRGSPVARSHGAPEPVAPAPRHVPESVIHYYTPLAIQEGNDVPWDGPLFSWVIAPGGRP